MALLHCRTGIRIRTRIPNEGIGIRIRVDLCNVNIQHITILAKGKRVRVRQCERAITETTKICYLELYSSIHAELRDRGTNTGLHWVLC